MSLPSPASNDSPRAVLFIPHTLPGYEETSDLLIEKSLEVLHKTAIRKAEIQISTMFENSAAMLEGWSFVPSQDRGWGYKIYYSYGVLRGDLGINAGNVYEVTTAEECETD